MRWPRKSQCIALSTPETLGTPGRITAGCPGHEARDIPAYSTGTELNANRTSTPLRALENRISQ